MAKQIPKFENGSWSYVDAPAVPQQAMPTLLPCDIKDWKHVAKFVDDPKQPVANSIDWSLSDKTRDLLKKMGDGSVEFHKQFLEELNDLIRNPDFYNSDQFANVELSETTQELLAAGPKPDDLVRFNTLLLQDAVPNAVQFVPFVGPRPFEEQDGFRFFGRDRESREFVLRIVANAEVLLFAPSGAGKSSLISAKLIPMLKQRDCDVLPLANVHASALQEAAANRSLNPFVLSVLISWWDDQRKTETSDEACDLPRLTFDQLKSMTLLDYLQHLDTCQLGEPRLKVAFLDQFEEIFTYGRHHHRVELMEQLRDALNADPTLRVVFSMRGDRIDQMAKYIHILPQKLPVHLQLELLGERAALEAITKPLQFTNRSFAPGVAEKLVKGLRTVKVRNFERKFETIEEDFVEPVQLQVVCQSLWQSLPDDVTTIRHKHISQFANVEEALAEFYERCIEHTVTATGFGEGVLRDWFSRKLVTPARTRGMVFRDKKKTENIPNSVVDQLANQYIIRREMFGKQPWYRLTHDRFIEPVLKSNAKWEERAVLHVAPAFRKLKKKATQWKRATKKSNPAKFLTVDELREADRCLAVIASKGVAVHEELQAFVGASRESVQRHEIERTKRIAELEKSRSDAERIQAAEKAKRLRRLLGALALLLVVGAIAAYIIIKQQKELTRQTQELANQNHKALVDFTVSEGMQEVAAGRLVESTLWFQRAIQKNKELNVPDPMLQVRLNSVLMRLPRLNQIWFQSTGSVFPHVEFDPIKEQMICVDELGVARVRFGESGREFELPTREVVTFATFGPAGNRVLTVSGRFVELWDLTDFDSKTPRLPITLTHERDVQQAWFSPDGEVVVTNARPIVNNARPDDARADRANTATLASFWNSKTGRKIDGEHKNFFNISSANFLHPAIQSEEIKSGFQSKMLATSDHNALLCDPQNGSILQVLQHPSLVVFASFYTSENRAVTVTEDDVVRIWGLDASDVQKGGQSTGKLLWESKLNIEPSNEHSSSANVILNGNKLLICRHENTARLWKLPEKLWKTWVATAMGQNTFLLQHSNDIKHMAFSNDGKRIVTCSSDYSARIWNTENGNLIHHLKHDNDVNYATFSRDGRFLATAGRDKLARVWDVRTGTLIVPPLLHNDSLSHVAFDDDGLRLWTVNSGSLPNNPAGERGVESRYWDLFPETKRSTRINYPAPIAHSEISSDGKFVATACKDGSTIVSSAETGQMVAGPIRHEGPATFATFDQANRRVVSCGVDGKARIWSLARNAEVAVIEFEGKIDDRNLFANIDPSGKYLVMLRPETSGNRGEAQLWNINSNHRIRSFPKAKSGKIAKFSPKGKYLAVTNDKNSVEVWHMDPKAGWLLYHEFDESKDGRRAVGVTPAANPPRVLAFDFSPDEKQLVTASSDDTAQVLDLESRKRVEMNRPPKHSTDIIDVRFSEEDGSKVVTVSKNGIARIWNAKTGKPTCRPMTHGLGINSAKFCRNDNWLVTLSRDKTARIWDAKTGQAISPPLDHVFDLKDIGCIDYQNESLIYALCYRDASLPPSTSNSPIIDEGFRSNEAAITYWPMQFDETKEQAALTRLYASHRLDQHKGLVPIESSDLLEQWQSVLRVTRDHLGYVESNTRESRIRRRIDACEIANDWEAAIVHLTSLIDFLETNKQSEEWELFARRCRAHLLLGDVAKANLDYAQSDRIAKLINQSLVNWLSCQAQSSSWIKVPRSSADRTPPTMFFLDKLIEIQNNNWEHYAARSLAWIRMKNLDKAKKDLDRAQELAGSDPERLDAWRTRQLRMAKRTGQNETIGFFLDRTIDADDKDWKSHQKRAETHLAASQFESALVSLNKAIELNSNSRELLLSRANVFESLAKYDSNADKSGDYFDHAVEDYTTASKLEGNKFEELKLRGRLYERMGDYENAIADYWSAYTETPDVELLRVIESAYWLLDDWTQLVTDLTVIIDGVDKNSQLYAMRGQANKTLKQWKNAGADFEKAIELSSDPRNNPLRMDLATAYAEQANWEDAEREFSEYLNQQNENLDDFRLLVHIYLETENEEKFRGACESMIEKYGRNGSPRDANNIAWTCALLPGALNNLDPAIKLSEYAVSTNPESRVYLNTFGALLFRVERYDDAIETLNEASRLDPEPVNAVWDWIFLAMCHHRIDQPAEAQKWFDKANDWIENNANSENNPLTWDAKIELQALLKEAKTTITNSSLKTE